MMQTIFQNLNSTFVSNLRDLYGKEGEDWINNLSSRVIQLSEKWNFRFLNVMPNLTYNFVALVEVIPTGERAILKMGLRHENIATEVRWLQCFSKGIPKVYWHDDEYHAFLMKCLEPENSLKTLVKIGQDDCATRTLCRTIRDLQSHQQKKSEFPHISELAGSLSSLKNHFDGRMLSKAESLFHELTTDRTKDVVLHGDLHHDNVLSSGATWKVIDPHGYVGDPAFEVGAMIYNPCDYFPKESSLSQIVERRLKILAEELPFDAKRIKAWAYCRTALSIAWTFEDHGTLPAFEIEIASAIDQAKI
ncbi:aminoglycoside phosphotransferase family protein [Kamptonema cortianum]|nr:aminoglycoside phosphotransferase family protein [Geitlerinema splendidum]MDK3161271.1 aminoglycoside phosphotransferase family protein [Kamptonema cortianum]